MRIARAIMPQAAPRLNFLRFRPKVVDFISSVLRNRDLFIMGFHQ
jgi:hypothetical protein